MRAEAEAESAEAQPAAADPAVSATTDLEKELAETREALEATKRSRRRAPPVKGPPGEAMLVAGKREEKLRADLARRRGVSNLAAAREDVTVKRACASHPADRARGALEKALAASEAAVDGGGGGSRARARRPRRTDAAAMEAIAGKRVAAPSSKATFAELDDARAETARTAARAESAGLGS